MDAAGYSDADIAGLQQEAQFYSEIHSAIKKHSGEELDIKPYEADMRHLINTYIPVSYTHLDVYKRQVVLCATVIGFVLPMTLHPLLLPCVPLIIGVLAGRALGCFHKRG